mmetsp:Transcript_81384/g.251209  ORF Transcript_81384/g.251209 Transcript_81384/m.251209 type:complete len:356 (-) Transcript_81384:463-1530(-)
MGHHVQLAALLHHVVEVHEDVADVTAPAGDEDVLRLHVALLVGWRLTLIYGIERFWLVGVVVLRYDDQLVARLQGRVHCWIQPNQAVCVSKPDGDGVRESAHELAEREPPQLRPLPHVELVACEAQQGLVDLGQARTPPRHDHQAAQDVVRRHRLAVVAAHQLEQGLVVDVADLGHDEPLQAVRHRPEHQDAAQGLRISLVRLIVIGEDNDRPGTVGPNFDEVVRQQRGAAAENDLGAQKVLLWQPDLQLRLHVLLTMLGHHHDDPTSLALVRDAQLLNEKDGLLCPPQDEGVVLLNNAGPSLPQEVHLVADDINNHAEQGCEEDNADDCDQTGHGTLAWVDHRGVRARICHEGP